MRQYWQAIIAAGAVCTAVAGCAGGQSVPPPSQPIMPPSTTTVQPSPLPPTSPAPGSDGRIVEPTRAPNPPSSSVALGPEWSTAEKIGQAHPELGAGILYSIRYARHTENGGFDRFVCDFKGPIPGFQVKYVDKVTQDGSGAVVNMPGSSAFLEVRFANADAHYDGGIDALPAGQREGTPGLPQLHIYKLTGDYEAVVHVALGLNGKTPFRVGTVIGPNGGQTSNSFYVDVHH